MPTPRTWKKMTAVWRNVTMNAKIALTPKYTYGGCPAEEKKQPAPTQAGSGTVEDGAVSSAAFADIVPEISAAQVCERYLV